MNTCMFTIHFKKMSTCSKVFVEGINFFVELEGAAYSSFHLASLIPEASPNIEKLKRACFKSFWHFSHFGLPKTQVF